MRSFPTYRTALASSLVVLAFVACGGGNSSDSPFPPNDATQGGGGSPIGSTGGAGGKWGTTGGAAGSIGLGGSGGTPAQGGTSGAANGGATTGGKGGTATAGSGTAGSGQAGGAQAGSGQAGSGQAGGAQAGSGQAGSGQAGSAQAGSGTGGSAGSGVAGSGTAGSATGGTGTAGSSGGSAGSGTAGTSSGGTTGGSYTCTQTNGGIGCCDGSTLYYCTNQNFVTSQACGTMGCGWNATQGYYDCGFSGTDPNGTPATCGGTGTGGSGTGGSGTGGSTASVCQGQSGWACDPISTTAQCMGPGSACDLSNTGTFACFGPPNDVPVGGACDDQTTFCVQGATCHGGTCARYCCADSDCASGATCQQLQMQGITVTVGICTSGGGTGGSGGSGTGGSGGSGTAGSGGSSGSCGTPVSFANDVLPIFANNCTSCHWQNGNWPPLDAADAYANLVNVQGSCSILVTPGNPSASASELIAKLTGFTCGTQMPQNAAPLSSATIKTIEDWICQGAKNN